MFKLIGGVVALGVLLIVAWANGVIEFPWPFA
jgi:hypothetical protein